MKVLVVVCGLLAAAAGSPGIPLAYSYANPAGTTYFNTPALAAAPLAAAPVAAAPAAYAAPAQVANAYNNYNYPAYHHTYAAPAVAAPALAVTKHVGYQHHQIPVQVPGVADVPITKLALTQGVTQKLVDVAHPAVTNRRIKVRRPALRKEFYDIEHRVIVRPAGSATLELSQPIAKEQKGPAVITPTAHQQVAPVVRYGLGRQIIDGPGVSQAAQVQANYARGISQAAPAPQPQPEFRQAAPAPQQQQFQQAPQPQFEQAQQQPQPEFRQAAPAPQQQFQQAPQPQFQQAQQQPQPEFRQAAPAPQQQFQQAPQPQFRQAQQQPQQQPEFRQAAPAQRQRPLQLRPQGAPQARSNDAEIIDADFAPQQQQQRPAAPVQAAPAPGPQLAPRLAEMPVEIQARLLELLSARGGTVTEYVGENGQPANSASVLQVADALQDVNLQGGERITTRRIVVTRPIETIQEVDIQEPATKLVRTAVNVPTLFKTPVQGVARVPVNIPAVKNVATPVVQTHYAQPAYQYAAAAPVAHAHYAAAPVAHAQYAAY